MSGPQATTPTSSSSTDLPEERRVARSSDALLSLSRCFESTRRRTGLDTLVLADLSGLAIAGAGPSAACEELAARAAVPPANDTVPCRFDVVTRAFSVRRLRIDGIEILLCAEGGSPEPLPLLEAVAACERILGRPKRG